MSAYIRVFGLWEDEGCWEESQPTHPEPVFDHLRSEGLDRQPGCASRFSREKRGAGIQVQWEARQTHFETVVGCLTLQGPPSDLSWRERRQAGSDQPFGSRA